MPEPTGLLLPGVGGVRGQQLFAQCRAFGWRHGLQLGMDFSPPLRRGALYHLTPSLLFTRGKSAPPAVPQLLALGFRQGAIAGDFPAQGRALLGAHRADAGDGGEEFVEGGVVQGEKLIDRSHFVGGGGRGAGLGRQHRRDQGEQQ